MWINLENCWSTSKNKKRKKKKSQTRNFRWFICSSLVSSLLAICRKFRSFVGTIVCTRITLYLLFIHERLIDALQKRLHFLDIQTNPDITIRKICFWNIYCAKGANLLNVIANNISKRKKKLNKITF